MVEASIDLKDIEDGFFGISKRATADKKQFWAEIKPIVKKDLKEHGRRREGPSGAWPGASPSTRARIASLRDSSGRFRKRDGRRRAGIPKANPNLGKIPSAWKTFMDPDSIKFRNMVDWAHVHNDGGPSGRGGAAKQPARPFAWISEETETAIVERWADFVAEGWERRP